MTDGLFNEHPDWMTGKMVSKPAQKKRDELFERLLSIFHPSLQLDAIPDTVRARLNKACKQFRAWPGFDMSELMVRYGRMKGQTRWTTALALSGHWDEFGGAPVTTRQPGMPSQAAQDAERQSDEIHRRKCDDELAERNRAVQAVQLADANVVKKLHEDWKADPANCDLVRFGPLPTSRVCVRSIAEQLEARNA